MFFHYNITYSSTSFIVVIISEYPMCTNMNVGKTEKRVNAFKHVCGYMGSTTVIETYPTDPTSYQKYQKTILQMHSNPYLNDCNIPHFMLQVGIIQSKNKHPGFTVWVPHGCESNIIIDENAKSIKFVEFNKLPPSTGNEWVTFIFEFVSDEHYFPNDDIGSIEDGWIPHIEGVKEGEVILGHSAASHQQSFLTDIQPVLHNQQASEEQDNDSGDNNGAGVFAGPLYLPSFTDHV